MNLLKTVAKIGGVYIGTEEKDILEQWDNPNLLFPAIPPYEWGYANARLTVYRSVEEWLSVIEIIGFDAEVGLPLNEIRGFGNKISFKKRWHYEEFMLPTQGTEFDFDDDNERVQINPLDFEVIIRGVRRRFSWTLEDYARIGIDLTKITTGPLDPIVKALRLLTFVAPDEMFLSNSELLQKLGRSNSLPLFLRLKDWYHPDYRKKEKPSDSVCLRNLANAISQNNKQLYECPSTLGNVHWSFWPEYPN